MKTPRHIGCGEAFSLRPWLLFRSGVKFDGISTASAQSALLWRDVSRGRRDLEMKILDDADHVAERVDHRSDHDAVPDILNSFVLDRPCRQ